jgi:branched-chain amino acid transport system ATP-binding protein
MADYILETKDLGISFGGLKAAQNVNLRIKKNQIYGLIGPNGAGKTTIFNLLTCVYKPTAGTFYLDGAEMKNLTPEKINQRGIARTFQNIRLFNNMTVVRNVMVGLHNRPEFKCSMVESILRLPRHFAVEKQMREKAKELLRIFDLEQERNSLACNLPYGKQRKLEIARALATNPKLLLLDEPAAGMNPQETLELADYIKEIRDTHNLTIFLIEHHMDLVMQISDYIYVIDFGSEIARGVPKEVQQNKRVIEAYLGVTEDE